MNNSKTIQSLLMQIGLITNKYEEIERITGEKYNIFSILGKSSDELAHSRFIANLLHPKGSHGQGDLYLRLFIDYMRDKFNVENESENKADSNILVLDEFETKTASCKTEKHAGKVDNSTGEGGRIDIFLESGKKNIIIENKLYATDQYKQLVRYNEYRDEAPIFYLTLDGKDASKGSKQDLKEGIHYFRISYEEDILNWINQCVKESTSIPFIRETLRQYVNLIKRLTNQLTSNKMREEVKSILYSNGAYYKSAKIISDAYKEIEPEYYDEIFTYIEKQLKDDKINYDRKKANRDNHRDGLFIFLTDYSILDGQKKYAIGINIELRSNHMFFCAIKEREIRNYSFNNHKRFDKRANKLAGQSYTLDNKSKSRTGYALNGVFNFSKKTSDIAGYLSLKEEERKQFKKQILTDINTLINESGLRDSV